MPGLWELGLLALIAFLLPLVVLLQRSSARKRQVQEIIAEEGRGSGMRTTRTTTTTVIERERGRGNAVSGMIWMFIISLLLFWLPVAGPFIAGLVGGKKSGGVGGAIMAVFLPGILFGLLLFFLASTLSGLPLIGAIAGVGGFALSLAHIGPLLLGAIIGGLMA